jgi:HSP20 family protein
MSDLWKAPFLDFQQHLDDVFEKLIYRRWAIPNPAEWRPPVDIHESAEGYFIEIDLPSVPPDQVEIRLSDRELVVRGTRRETRLDEALLSHRERRCGPFRISLVLSQAVVPERASAEYREGTYMIRLVKKRRQGQSMQEAALNEPGTGPVIVISPS